jgi:hypothetical protein
VKTGGDEPRLGRGDFDSRLDYKVALGPVVARAFGAGRYTAWSENARDDRAIDRFAGGYGANLSTWIHGTFDTPFGTMRHVIVPTVCYEDVKLVTRTADQIVQFDAIDALRETEFFFARVRNRFQLASTTFDKGGGGRELFDLGVEARYFPRKADNAPSLDSFSTILFDAKLWALEYGSARCQVEMDPNHTSRLLILETSAQVTPWQGLALEGSYREIKGVTRVVGWGFDWRLTRSWSARLDEQYDLDKREFIAHRGVLRRYFHGFALELTGSHNPFLKDTSFSFSVMPIFEADDTPDPFGSGRLGGISGN